ncbi:hypothetical protein O6H91_12G093400 [Diphasiastrum complanatum]|uniref:Uncharacterized protein n=1 Tax=Diphasiastrum complanatum TaxID=34168 RepID=A0ACC2C4Y1_DIPCM|nr:hypothetical protein O6H91_12G093400 [Diphasiastrum complanatum]
MQEGDGLQVAAPNDTWELVPNYPNAFVVNLADQKEMITNGRYKSANHRAIVNSNRTRRSYVTFYHPAKDQKIFPAPELVDAKVERYCVPANYLSDVTLNTSRMSRTRCMV